jgi:hypothetical protein
MPVKNIVVILALLLVGAGAALIYLRINRQPAANTPSEVADTGHEALHKAAAEGKDKLCAVHNVPDAVCPFCHPEYIEKFGFCRGHDVPEAVCTRCSPVLILAFKAENDWCDEHNLPESQCKICQAAGHGTTETPAQEGAGKG